MPTSRLFRSRGFQALAPVRAANAADSLAQYNRSWTWSLKNLDASDAPDLVGQFDPELTINRGELIWTKRPGILGNSPWLKYVGRGSEEWNITFHMIATNVLDTYPQVAWARLNSMATYDRSLGRPCRVLFSYGPHVLEGYITELPDAKIEYFGGRIHNLSGQRQILSIGPTKFTITAIPRPLAEPSTSTNFVKVEDSTTFESIALDQYGDARYGQALAEYNYGAEVDDTLEVPPLGTPGLSLSVATSPLISW
jgi:hypothetical protein